MIVNKLFQGYTLNSYLFNMTCESHMEGLQNFAKQLEEQKATITAQIQSLDAQIAQAKNSYMKVEGAQEIIAIQIQKEEKEAKAAVAEALPEASGD